MSHTSSGFPDFGSTYPGQSGINPLPMDWGNKDPQKRGPVVVSRTPTTIRRRNGELVRGFFFLRNEANYYRLAIGGLSR